MNQIKVSVIVLTYNHEKYIRQALDSILMQKVDFKYEILIGDDASTDNTVNILNEYKNKYPDVIKLYLNKVNLGATRNAYNLLMSAKGEYLATCEGDDYWIDENKLKIQIDFLDNNKEFIGCTHQVEIRDDNGNKLKKQKLSWIRYKDIFTIKDFKGLYLPGQAGSVVRRNIYRDTKEDFSIFYKAHKFIGDRTTMMIYLSKGNFHCFNNIMSVYRVSNKNKSLTVKVYKENENRISNDFEYVKILDDYARNVLNVDPKFKYYVRYLFCDSVYAFIRNPSESKVNDIVKIYKSNFFDISFFIFIPVISFRKVWRKLFYLN